MLDQQRKMNPTPLLVIIPFCSKDIDLTRKLLGWIERLSPSLSPHCCLLAADSLVPKEAIVETRNKARAIFEYAEAALVNVPKEEEGGWPRASNAMFRIASRHAGECFRLPWLWLEPDCTPLVPAWLDLLALAYHRCPKKYLGAQIQSMDPQQGLPPVHLAGCAIYPPDAFGPMEPFCAPGASLAWDIGNASYVIPRSMNTPLIHHVYGTLELPPLFKAVKEPHDPINTCTIDFVRKDAVLFHRVKNGSLIDLLEKNLHNKPREADSGKRGPGRPPKSKVDRATTPMEKQGGQGVPSEVLT